ncbi:redoxin domain-containing protein [Hymenobacter sp. GOD-10R]|uniref:redoxin domain-containing protein n=1 Tax=Hymenobacter sp. GOD-10R TaxID=3093922 RepID=UPI002D780E7C|nr:redoxin domain-containing protein [Hymenobacter sp. GOD-10R]WRQ29716.1 redoxin domain-containing protein [Hymenobacter sp. GOD-10R]
MSVRRLSIIAAATFLFCTVAIGVASAQSNRSVNDFSLKNASNTEVSLRSYASSKAVVIAFVNPSCAFSKLYRERFRALTATYKDRGVQFIFINAPINLADGHTTDPGDAASLPFFIDEGQKVSALLGVTKTPEVVLLQPVGDGFAVRYKGAIDDNPQVEGFVKERYLATALDDVLAGRSTSVTDKRAAGCLIKQP